MLEISHNPADLIMARYHDVREREGSKVNPDACERLQERPLAESHKRIDHD